MEAVPLLLLAPWLQSAHTQDSNDNLPSYARPSQHRHLSATENSPLKQALYSLQSSLFVISHTILTQQQSLCMHAPLTAYPSEPPYLDVYLDVLRGSLVSIGYMFSLPQIRYEDIMPAQPFLLFFLPLPVALLSMTPRAFWIHYPVMFIKIELFLPQSILYLHTVV